MSKRKLHLPPDVDKKTLLVKGKVQYIDPEKLIPYEYNARKHQSEIDDLVNIIKVVGFPDAKAIEVDKNMVIINGHGRRLAAIKAGMKEVPYVIRDMPEELARTYRIADNKISDKSGWDYDILEMEYRELKEMDIPLEDFGFEDFSIDDFVEEDDGTRDAPTVVVDETETEIPEETIPDGPEIYKLGKHTIMYKHVDEIVDELVDGKSTCRVLCSSYNDFKEIIGRWENQTGKKAKKTG